MLKIQVLGKGLIPRGYGLAPRLNPFPADLILIGTILSTPGLTVNYLNPDTNKMCPLTKDNLKRIYNNYGMENNNITLAPQKAVLTAPKEEVPVQPPISLGTSLASQQEALVSPVNENNNEEKTEEKVEEKTTNSTSTEVADEKKDDQNNGSLKPINAPDNNNHNNNQNQNKNQQQFNKNGNNNKK